MIARRALLLAAALLPLAAGPAAAASKGGPAYAKIGSIVVEFWDQNGLFHVVNADLTAVLISPEAKLDKRIAEKITHALSAMSWEEFSTGNPASTLKAIALDIVRKEPGGELVAEVLVVKLMLR
ncbi:hypothetical protein [Magnetospirillum sp. UT-4]|uniref:hypothetical protein n=1 Tax=Magnetospirillum sp. UT-4 TaxID=2681467 RepID=UPI001382B703|nr:hypothetical protein [Magnetospirillum sp. UT-4]CAA7622631.1 conserved exported hypothetical protein [Magnetospirillum sp. UT-4]